VSAGIGPVGTITGIRYPSAVSYQFEWDPTKATSNFEGLQSFVEEASTVFADPLAMLMADPDHSEDEERYLLLGTSLRPRLLVVSFAERSNPPG
jgi:uncharacterized protein